DAISIVQTPAQTPDEMMDDGKKIEQPLQQLALVADAAPKTTQLGADLPKAVVGKTADNGKTKQVDADDEVKTDQPTDETDDAFQILTKDSAPKDAESKAQTGTGDGDKQHVSQGRGDFITASHRSAAGQRRQRSRKNVERRSDAGTDSGRHLSRITKCRSAGYSCLTAGPATCS